MRLLQYRRAIGFDLGGLRKNCVRITDRRDRVARIRSRTAVTKRDGGLGEPQSNLALFVSFDGLRFRRSINEAGDVRFQLGQIFLSQIHHVPGVVIL
jgi:hypothetical protein